MKLILFLVALVAAVSARADEVLSEKSFALPDRAGSVQVVIQKEDEAMLGHPYSVKVQASCERTVTQSSAMNTLLTKSVCDVKPKSPKLSEDGKSLLVTIRETDSDAYNEKTRTASPEELATLQPECKVVSTELRFDLSKMCQ